MTLRCICDVKIKTAMAKATINNNSNKKKMMMMMMMMMI